MTVKSSKRNITDFTDNTDCAISTVGGGAAAFLRRMASAARLGVAPDADDMSRVTIALDRVLSGESADTAFGLRPERGQRSWHTRAVLNQRDRFLREAARRFYGGLPVAAQAKHLHDDLTHYRTSAWTRECTCEACPDRHRETVHELLWHALTLHDYVLSARSIREILAAS